MRTKSLPVVFTALVAAAIPVMALCMARAAAPIGIPNEDIDGVLTAALAKPIRQFVGSGRSVVFVRGVDANTRLSTLQEAYSEIKLKPWAERPDDDGCRSSVPGTLVLAPCERNDFVSIGDATFPLWRTALIRVGVFNGGGDLILVNFAGKWRVLSEHWFVI